MEPLTLGAILTVLSANLWVGLLAVFLYFIWRGAPKVFELAREYLLAKSQEMGKMTQAINQNGLGLDRIGEAIHSFEKALIGTENRMAMKMEEVKEVLKEEIRDQKIEYLARVQSNPDLDEEEQPVLRTKRAKSNDRRTNPNIGS